MELKMINVNIMGVQQIFSGGDHKKTIIYGELPKQKVWTICRGLCKK